MSEEHIFILDWSRWALKILYGKFSESGELLKHACESEVVMGEIDEIPQDEDRSYEHLSRLKTRVEEKLQLQIQTLYCVRSGADYGFFPLLDPKPYEDFLTSIFLKKGSGALLPAGEIPEHHEVVDVFRNLEEPRGHWAMTIPSIEQAAFEKLFHSCNCFLEGFLILPRIQSPSVENENILVLGLHNDGCTWFIQQNGNLLDFQTDEFSIIKLAHELSELLDLGWKDAMEIIQITMNLNQTEISWDKRVDWQHVLTQNLSMIQNFLADRMESFVTKLRGELEQRDWLDCLGDHFFITGEGDKLYSQFTFLRDVLPLTPQQLVSSDSQAHDLSSRDLSLFFNSAFQKRMALRNAMKSQNVESLWHVLKRRFLGN